MSDTLERASYPHWFDFCCLCRLISYEISMKSLWICSISSLNIFYVQLAKVTEACEHSCMGRTQGCHFTWGGNH